MFFLYKKFADKISKEFARVLSDPETLIAQGKIIKDDKSTTVSMFSWGNQSYIIKRFNARTKGHSVKRAMRRSRASNCWQMSHTFANCGITVANPIAMLEKRRGIFKADSYFISELIEGAEMLEWLPKQPASMHDNITQQVEHIFAIFAKNKLSHGDMKATNLLWSNQQIALIDLDAAKQHSSQFLFARAHARDKRRFSRNGALFESMLETA